MTEKQATKSPNLPLHKTHTLVASFPLIGVQTETFWWVVQRILLLKFGISLQRRLSSKSGWGRGGGGEGRKEINEEWWERLTLLIIYTLSYSSSYPLSTPSSFSLSSLSLSIAPFPSQIRSDWLMINRWVDYGKVLILSVYRYLAISITWTRIQAKCRE